MATVVAARDTRVEDYLNDKLQTVEDLGSLETLLKQVEQQHGILQQQLSKSATELEQAQKTLKGNSFEILTKTSDFQQQNDILSERLEAVTTSEEAADVVFRFKQGIEKLSQLNIAKGYISILLEVEDLRQKVRSKIPHDLQGALEPYNQLQRLSQELKSKHDAAEGAAVHLIDFVRSTTIALWDEMKSKLIEQFQATLTKIEWPKTEIPEKHMEEFDAGFSKLLMLQKNELDSGLSKPILAFEVLVKAFALRFRYHFEGERPTNRVDKPEWYLTHLVKLFDEYAPLFSEDIQDILDHNGLAARDGVQEFITAVLPILKRKVDLDMPIVSAQGPLSSHLVEELSKFDILLREEYMYAPYGQDPSQWRGVTHEILTQNNGEFFNNWLLAEKQFALARYDSVITAEDAWALDFDSLEHGSTKPTKSAIRLKDLLETITERYRPLISFSQRLRFLMDIQIAVLDQYHERLQSSVEAFNLLTSRIGRAVHGSASKGSDSVGGVTGLERLCRVYGSAVYLEEFMKDWGEDVFFLELWEELQRRAQHGASASGGMSMDTIAERTSSTITSGEEDGALFDETAASYRNLRNAVEPMMTDLIMSTLREDLKPYSQISTWHSVEMVDPVDGRNPPPTTELTPVVKSLSAFFNFLHRALSSTLFHRLMRLTFLGLQSHLMDTIVQKHQFSEQGGIQFQRDVVELWGTTRRWNIDLDNATRKIKETCMLLALPTTAATSAEGDADESPALTLSYVREKMFEDNSQARKISLEIGLQSLTVNEARDVLQRRVENWS